MKEKYIFVTVSLLDNLDSVYASIFKLNKFYSISKYVVIVPKNNIEVFEEKLKVYENVEIVEEDKICCKRQFLNLCDVFIKSRNEHQSFRKSWYYQQILKLSYVTNKKYFSNNNLIIWDADTIPLKKIKLFNKYNQPYLYGSVYEYHPPYFMINKILLGPKSSMLNLSCINQFVALNLQIRKDLEKFFLKFNRLNKIKNNDLFVANAILKTLAIGQNINSKIESKFSEYEFIGNFISNKYNKRNIKQKRIKFFRNNVDGNINLIQKIILYFFNYKHITYENNFNNDQTQTYKNLFLCIVRDLSCYIYIRKIKKIIFSKKHIYF